MKSGLFKKILKPENETTMEPIAADHEEEDSSLTASAAHHAQLPPPRRPESASKSHDPFEDDEDFGFVADEPESETVPVLNDPTFAIPEEKQMSQSPPTPASPPPPSSESESIRQLELRAIFGVDHEMGVDEILERSRKLNGVRLLTRLADGDAGTIDALKAMIGRLGLGAATVQIYAGSIPVEFIREGNVALAVQTDSGFAPGVRETLIIVARELTKM